MDILWDWIAYCGWLPFLLLLIFPICHWDLQIKPSNLYVKGCAVWRSATNCSSTVENQPLYLIFTTHVDKCCNLRHLQIWTKNADGKQDFWKLYLRGCGPRLCSCSVLRVLSGGASLQTLAPKMMSQTVEKRSVTMQTFRKDKGNHLLLSLDYFVCQHPSALCDLIESVALRTLVGWRAHRWDWGTTRHDRAKLMRCDADQGVSFNIF